MSIQQPAASSAAYSVASLYVGDLHPEVTEAMLFEKFSAIGPVLSIRVCRDLNTRRSLGYAYVNFQNQNDAETALGSMNFDDIKGRPMRIMWSQRDPSLRRSGKNNIFIKNLDKTIDNRALHELFQSFGPILSCKVAQDEHGVSRGYAFVHFQDDTSPALAIEKVNGMLVNDRKVFVGPFIPRKERLKSRDTSKFTNIYVKNFDESMTDEKLKELFSPFGTITSCKVMLNKDGVSKGFGFCAFQDPACADAAVKALHDKPLEEGGKPLYAARAQKRAERDHELQKLYKQKRADRQKNYQGVNLYVKNLDDEFTDDRLRKEFAVFGNITSAKVMLNEQGTSKGFGFVCFSSPEEATKAVTEMNNRVVLHKPLYVALAQRKDERKALLETTLLNQSLTQPQIRLPGQHVPPMFPAPPLYMVPNRQFPLQPLQMRGPRPSWHGRGPQHPYMMGPANAAPFIPHGPARLPNSSRSRSALGRTLNGGPSRPPQGGKSRPLVPQRYQPQGTAVANGGTSTAVNGHSGLESLDTERLARATPQEQKQMLGEQLFPRVRAIEPHNSGKITGMLLEIDNSEILHMLESEDSLRAKVEEARDVLRLHQASNGTAELKKMGK